jgi:UDP-N-acetylglucosamine--N-acetylmuramyl-(pentapeptide) pyrophosphoryl-undecaprenol N-acetylglucosamine transferase
MSMVGPTSVLFAGGGTGGHLFPGIAVAQELVRRYPSTTVMFVGAGRILELQLLAREGFSSERIRTSGLAGKSGGSLLRGLLLIPVSMFDAYRLIRRYSPDLVVGLGGYSSGPVVLAGWQQGLPTLLLEQNVIPGITNRILARFVSAGFCEWKSCPARFFRSATGEAANAGSKSSRYWWFTGGPRNQCGNGKGQ